MSNQYEEKLQKEAQRRVDFKRHLLTYIIVIGLLWLIWAFSGGGYMWPVWPTAGWGIALFFHHMGVFNRFHFFSVEQEIQKLKQGEKVNSAQD